MNTHNLFYYPYASCTNAQLPLLKVAALWFEKLVILDPIAVSWDTICTDRIARDAVRQLTDAGIKVVTPADALAKYERPIADAIRRDITDHKFLDLCDAQIQSTGKQHWTPFLAKILQDLQANQTMRHLPGDFACEVARDSGQYREREGGNPSEYYECAETGQAYDEYCEGYDRSIEYRYADFPLALGEAIMAIMAIMMNHTLFAGLLHACATPITDAPFHSQALAFKLHCAGQPPPFSAPLLTGGGRVNSKPINWRLRPSPTVCSTCLCSTRNCLWMMCWATARNTTLRSGRHTTSSAGWRGASRRSHGSESLPTSPNTRSSLTSPLNWKRAARRDSWLESQRGRLALSVTGIAVGAAAAVLPLVAAPLAAVALATTGLGLVPGTAIPGAEWLFDWRAGRRALRSMGCTTC